MRSHDGRPHIPQVGDPQLGFKRAVGSLLLRVPKNLEQRVRPTISTAGRAFFGPATIVFPCCSSEDVAMIVDQVPLPFTAIRPLPPPPWPAAESDGCGGIPFGRLGQNVVLWVAGQ